MRYVPNALTAIRLCAIPLFVWLVASAEGPTSVPAAIFFGALALTDWLDGWLARRFDAKTRFGRIVDPIADHVLITVGLLSLISLGRVAWPIPTLIVVRDITLGAGFFLLSRRGYVATVDRAGKLSALVVMTAVTLALAGEALWIDGVLLLGAALSVMTLANYLAKTAVGAWPRAKTG
jgi:CDP-diacylglycerol--glycerol-3-phosphate 3-phosphatidyltransferase